MSIVEKRRVQTARGRPCAGAALRLYCRGKDFREAPMFMFKKTLAVPAAGEALPGRADAVPTAAQHFINGRALKGPYPDGLETAMFGMGCFWGAERKFWELGDGIWVTAV